MCCSRIRAQHVFAADHPRCANEAVETYQRVLKSLLRNMPINLLLGYDMVDKSSSNLFNSSAQARAGEFPHRQITRGSKEGLAAGDNRYVLDGKRQMQLLSILDLLRYAEGALSELDLETSAVLMKATIADVARNLE